MSDAGDKLTVMPVDGAAVISQQHDKSLKLNPMIEMASFFEQQDEMMDYDGDDMPPFPSEPQTPTTDR